MTVQLAAAIPNVEIAYYRLASDFVSSYSTEVFASAASAAAGATASVHCAAVVPFVVAALVLSVIGATLLQPTPPSH